MRSRLFIFLFFILACGGVLKAQDSASAKPSQVFVGLRFQKAVGFYYINGLSAEFSSPKLCKQKISAGFNFVSSRLGSALASNAIAYSEVNLSAIKYFRNDRPIKPLVRLNLGYARANFGSDEFGDLPAQSFLASIEGGAAYDLKFPLRITLAGGYNIITGNGMKGLGVLFPLYAQCSLFYRISIK
jgi:hypothetical protein